MQNIKKIPFHVFFFASYSSLHLLSSNLTEVSIQSVFRPLILTLLFAGALYFLLNLILNQRAEIFASFLILLFFSYGFMYDVLKLDTVFSGKLGHHKILAPIYLAIFFMGMIYLFQKLKKEKLDDLRSLLNYTSIFLLLFPSAGIIRYQIENSQPQTVNSNQVAKYSSEWQEILDSNIQLGEELPIDLPDIYYIIPDMYARQDAILADVGFDNSEFIDSLRELGFYVADCSRSNYAITLLSLPSSFNINYLSDLGDRNDEQSLSGTVENSVVRMYLKELGYKSVSFENSFGKSKASDFDYVLGPDQPAVLLRQIQAFELMLLKSTIVRIPLDVRLGAMSSLLDQITFPFHDHAIAQEFIIETLSDFPTEIEGPKFVFAHIMVPHPPYIFNPDGSLVSDVKYYKESWGLPSDEEHNRQGYTNQIEFIGEQLLILIENILDQSETPPIILLQGDHGSRGDFRLQILNAYYLPEAAKDSLYPTISPVNSFRLIFNEIFNSNYEFLEDTSFYSENPNRFDLTEVEELSEVCNTQ